MDDAQITALFWQRSEEAIAQCQRAYHGLFLHLAQNITGSFQDAEEAASDTYEKLWNSIPPNRPDNLRAYALKILRNSAIDLQRKNARQKQCASLDTIFEELGECLPAADDGGLDTLELRDLLERFLARQSRQNRILFLRRYFQCEPLDQLARQAGLHQKAAEMRLLRMRQALAEELRKEL